jgi:hypothetical protein
MVAREAGLATVIASLGLAGCLPAGGHPSADGGDVAPDALYCAASESAVIRPAILILADRSSEMATDPRDMPCTALGCSKWDRVVATLEQVVLQTDATVDWGLKLFPSGTDACGVSSGPDVPCGPHNAAAIVDALVAASPGGEAPLEVAELDAATILSDPADNRPHFILLATDGRPTCAPGTADPAAIDVGAEGSLASALSAGVPTLVLGDPPVSDRAASDTLTLMANRGGLPRAPLPPSYYSVDDASQLISLATTSVGGHTCSLLIPTVPQANTTNAAIDVFLDGALVPRDTQQLNGWDYTDSGETSIALYGDACVAWAGDQTGALVVAFRCVGA